MKNKNYIWLLLLVTFIVCLIIVVIFLFIQRAQAKFDRPLVLIHSPYPHQQIDLGHGTAIHATARSATGIKEMELWIDDQLLATQGASGDKNSFQVLHSIWQPLTTGEHTIAVRALSTRGVTGQSLITIEVTSISDSSPTIVELLPGDLQDPVTTSHISTAEEMIGSAEDEDPTDGDDSVIPEDVESFPDEGDESLELPLLPEDSSPPGSYPSVPGSWTEILESIPFRVESSESDTNDTTLRLEILTLETGLDYEQLHCYISLGDFTPQWVPDLDLDPTTDESFISLGDGGWDVFSVLGGENASVFPWSADSPLPLDFRCVGIVGGGTEALELGRLLLSISPESWDGITRRAESDLREGNFYVDYRVTNETGPVGFPIDLDPDLPSPTNLSTGWWSLTWDYLELDEPEILGFRIYLNDAYQWRVPAEDREANLPFEWFNPPCGTDYIFTVTAYYISEEGIDYESHPSYPPVVISSGEIGDEGCDRTIQVNFKTLTVGRLSRDGDREDSNGPAYGSLFVNEHISQFDGRCGRDDPCGIMRLYENQNYDLHAFTTTLGDGTPPRFTLQVPQSEGLNIGFEIWDEDPGSGGDDLICSVTETIESDDLNTPHTRILSSEYNRCQVKVDINIALGSPVGGSDGEPPLPLLTVTDLSVDETTGQLLIQLLNEGAATWAGYDLDLLVRWPSGEPIGAYIIPELVLLPGQSTIIRDPDLIPGPHPPLGACVLLDPGNEVPEEDDRMPGWTRGEYCRPLPDLTITNVQYAPTDERLLITVRNIGEGTIENRNMDFRIDLPDGRYLAGPAEWWSGVSLNQGASLIMEWPNIDAGDRELFRGGYTVTVDPTNDIAETSGTNNVYTVPAVERLMIYWASMRVPGGFPNSEFNLSAYLLSIGSRELIDNWEGPPGGQSGWTGCPDHCFWQDARYWPYQTQWFEIFGDQELMVTITLNPGPLYSGQSQTNIHVPANFWGSDEIQEYNSCGPRSGLREFNGIHRLSFSGYGWYEGWITRYLVCRLVER